MPGKLVSTPVLQDKLVRVYWVIKDIRVCSCQPEGRVWRHGQKVFSGLRKNKTKIKKNKPADSTWLSWHCYSGGTATRSVDWKTYTGRRHEDTLTHSHTRTLSRSLMCTRIWQTVSLFRWKNRFYYSSYWSSSTNQWHVCSTYMCILIMKGAESRRDIQRNSVFCVFFFGFFKLSLVAWQRQIPRIQKFVMSPAIGSWTNRMAVSWMDDVWRCVLTLKPQEGGRA